jgi:hypothetical protein
MLEMPRVVKKLVLPVVYRLGLLLGRYRHFEGAPEPVKVSR